MEHPSIIETLSPGEEEDSVSLQCGMRRGRFTEDCGGHQCQGTLHFIQEVVGAFEKSLMWLGKPSLWTTPYRVGGVAARGLQVKSL